MAEGELKCTVLFFAAAAQATGCRKQELTIASGATVSDVFDAVALQHEAFSALKARCAIAIDQQLVPKDAKVTNNCTIAFLPPVSGG